MVVVPAVAEGKYRQNPVVAAFVRRLESTGPEGVPEGVDRVRDLTEECHPHEPTPQEAAPAADRERNSQAEQDPDDCGAVDEHDERVPEQPLAIALSLRSGTAQDPAEVRVDEPVQRAVRIARTV